MFIPTAFPPKIQDVIMLRNLGVREEALQRGPSRADRAEDRVRARRGLLPAARRKARLKLLTSL